MLRGSLTFPGAAARPLREYGEGYSNRRNDPANADVNGEKVVDVLRHYFSAIFFAMCGRYALGKAIPEVISRYIHLGTLSIASEQTLLPSFNIAPSTQAAVIFQDGGEAHIGPMRWGLVPRWAKTLDALKSKPINARSETADTGAMFRDAFRSARCLVPATGFFEWQGSKPPKQPWFIHVQHQEILSFAGLWSRWKESDSETELLTFTILTTEANETVKPIHDRMPCILRPDDEAEWLDSSTNAERCKSLLRPYSAGETEAYRVSTAVNKPCVGGKELIATIEPHSGNPGALLC